jgi:hypothetical protein
MFNAEILPPVVVPPSGTPPGDELVEPMYAVGDASGVLAKADVEPKVPTALFPGTGVTFIALAGAAVRSSLPHTRNGENLPTSNEAVPDIVRFLYVVGAVSVVVPALIERSEAVLQSPNIGSYQNDKSDNYNAAEHTPPAPPVVVELADPADPTVSVIVMVARLIN